jgi:hypothetical protein
MEDHGPQFGRQISRCLDEGIILCSGRNRCTDSGDEEPKSITVTYYPNQYPNTEVV